MLGLPPAAASAPAPTARMAIVPTMTAATHVLRHRLGLGDVAKHLAAHRRRQRRRRTGQAEARREYQCDHDRAHSILLGFRSGPQNGPLSLGLQFNQDCRQDARSIFRGQQRRIHVLFRCAHHMTARDQLPILATRSDVSLTMRPMSRDKAARAVRRALSVLQCSIRCWMP